MKYVSPSARKTAFNCPHCGAFAKQDWFSVHASQMAKNSTPQFLEIEDAEDLASETFETKTHRDKFLEWAARCAEGLPFFDFIETYQSVRVNVCNVWFSLCFNCDDISLWVFDRLFFPRMGKAPPASPDLPTDIRRDYDEASSILDLSPRGAAALIRLCIQKLCKELGQSGKNINDDIGKLVAAGLDSRVQQALDGNCSPLI